MQNQVKGDEDTYKQKKYDFIPISPKLIEHVRRLDGFDNEQLSELKMLMTQVAKKMNPQFSFKNAGSFEDPIFRKFMETTLKIHQILALVDVNFSNVFPSNGSTPMRSNSLNAHYYDIVEQLQMYNGLNYCPRERSSSGRVFEHAADSKIIIDHLIQLQDSNIKDGGANEIQWFFKIVEDHAATKDKADDEANNNEIKLAEKYQKTILDELKIKSENVVLNINKPFIQLTMKANGKADLYFHAYFWEKYIHSISDNTKLTGPPASKTTKQPAGTSPGKKAQRRGMVDPDEEEKSEDMADVSANDKPATTSDKPINIFDTNAYPFMKRLMGLSATLSKVIVNIKKFPFHEKMYMKYANEFGQRQTAKKMKYLEEIQRALFVAQIADDQNGLYWIEKLLIQLQGYCDISIRDQAVVLLNMLYDGVDWQLQEAFRPVIRQVGQHFIVKVIVQRIPKQQKDSQIFLGLGAPSPILGNNKHILTWHKVEERNIEAIDNVQQEININFGKFWKCGFYDWRLVSISEDGKLMPLEIIGKPADVFPHAPVDGDDEYYEQTVEEEIGCIAQGRFIVHAKGMREQSFHEVQIDFQNAKIDKESNSFIQRGTFRDVEYEIGNYAQQGISTLYLMGALERDNYPFQSQYMGELDYKKPNASPLATIDRTTPNKMLGGEEAFQRVMRKAKDHKVKIITDCLARISSSRHHRKYKDLLLHYLDADGRINICYGTDGQAQKFEDTAMLNYRKIEAWNLLIEETIQFCDKYGVDGIHLDNGQAWPQIMEPDLDELQRLDVDGVPAYTPEDLMNGEVVIRNENYGYWNSNNMETYPNPFFIKMCKKLWLRDPNFMIIGECWGGFMFEHRQIILARSGIVPRLYKLPIAISKLFGKKLHRNGVVESTQKDNVVAIKKWYDETRRFLPEGTILMQSSTAHCLPYPAYLYGKGTWAAIDILFFMPDIPITYNGELQGEVYKVGQIQTVFQHDQTDLSKTPGQQSELKRTNSMIMRALQDQSSKDETTKDELEQSHANSSIAAEERRGLPKVRSGTNLAQVFIDVEEGRVAQKEQVFKQQLQPEEGFDLSQVNTHYQHRRQLRREKMVLRYGELILCGARDEVGEFLNDIIVYARYSLMETIIIATSLTNDKKKFRLDLGQLLPVFKKAYPGNTVVMVKNIISDDGAEPEYYFLREFIELKTLKTLPGYRSLMVSITICEEDQFIFKKCLTNSIERTKRNLLAGKSIENEQISLLFSDCVEYNPGDIDRFANVIGSIQSSFLDKLNVSFRDLFTNSVKLSQNPELSSRLMAMTGYIIQQSGGQMIAPVRAAQAIHDTNKLGPIVFCTPELGRWSTVGGLGVMVDELSIGLAELGQEVICISPYYERNRKGQTGYLSQDPAGIHYKDNVHVDIGPGFTLGVHEGFVSGVKVVFLHNGDVFPCPYPDAQPAYIVQQIAVFGKACLEYCCQRQIIPSVCVTNDWFTGLIAGYAKVGHFGDTFKGTCFLHICHNLQETYEGRIHLNPNDGGLEGLHKLPRDWLIDPQWKGNMINPSRCAIMLSDQWATVSKSYREDLLNSSSLCWLLRQKPHPFAFPNGIPIQARIKRMDKCAPDHMTAKRMLQKKYFNFGDLDDSIPLLAFVGRVTAQKGVHLILDIAEHIIHKFNYKVQFLVGGPANMKEPYAAGCAHKMWNLRQKYPHCFWAAPEEFFTDGDLVNRGADFGLMPSVFEPGGIVQHEFFVGSTPVVAFKTGGLKDSVIEYMWDSEEGTGYTFESHTAGDFIFAVERAIGTFRNKPKYNKLRENAFRGTMDGEIVCRAWLGEFCRLRGKIFIDYKVYKETESKFSPWHPSNYTPISIIQEIFGSDKKKQIFQEIDYGATEDEQNESPDRLTELDRITSAFDQAAFNKKPQIFMLQNRGPRYRKVEICGSFDEWQIRHEMNFDPFTNQWFASIHLKPGEDYYYKYIINDDQWVVNDEEPKKADGSGNVNNFCFIMN